MDSIDINYLFSPVTGREYYAYQRREEKSCFFSLIHPDKWGCELLNFIGAFKYQGDGSWKEA